MGTTREAAVHPFKACALPDAALSVIRHPECGIGLIADDFGGSGRVPLGQGPTSLPG
jgi:hypothetical protein